NGSVDGIQIAPKDTTAPSVNIDQIAIQRVSVTKSVDGGIDVNGCVSLPVTGCRGGTTKNVTLAENFIAANGTQTTTENGGGNLTKYGVTNVTMVGNFWDKNYRRNPLVDNRDLNNNQVLSPSFADVHNSLVRSPLCAGPGCLGWVEIFKTGAQVNVVNSCFEGSSNYHVLVRVGLGGSVYTSGNSVPPPDPGIYTPVPLDGTSTTSSTPFSQPPPPGQQACLSHTNRSTVFGNAGAAPRDCVDECFIDLTTPAGQEANA